MIAQAEAHRRLCPRRSRLLARVASGKALAAGGRPLVPSSIANAATVRWRHVFERNRRARDERRRNSCAGLRLRHVACAAPSGDCRRRVADAVNRRRLPAALGSSFPGILSPASRRKLGGAGRDCRWFGTDWSEFFSAGILSFSPVGRRRGLRSISLGRQQPWTSEPKAPRCGAPAPKNFGETMMIFRQIRSCRSTR